MNKIDGKGLIAGIIAWLLTMWYATTQSACLKTKSCAGDDLLIFAAIGVGMLAPAWIVACIFSSETDK